MNEVQYYAMEESANLAMCTDHSRKFGINDTEKYADENKIQDCVQMPCAKGCPFYNFS